MDDHTTKAMLDDCRAVCVRLNDEVKHTTRIWAIVESFNGRDEAHRVSLHSRINRLGLGATAEALIKALARDTLASLFRMTDAPGPKNERLTFCRLSAVLHNDALTATLEKEARKWHQHLDDDYEEENAEIVRQNISHVQRLVPADWKTVVLQDRSLQQLRERLRPVRDRLLAHAMDYSEIQQLTWGETRDYLKLVAELQGACSLVFFGSAENLQMRWDARLSEANDFWDLMTDTGPAANDRLP